MVQKRERMNMVGKSIEKEENKHNSKKNDRILEGKVSVKRNERRCCGERKATMGEVRLLMPGPLSRLTECRPSPAELSEGPRPGPWDAGAHI